MSGAGAPVALVGATGGGKTAVSEVLAELLGAEIVCADSRQVFRELEVGTGKPTAAERAGRPHHLFDTLALGEPASAGWYARAAGATLEDIAGRERRALLVGGSGLYLHAASAGLFPEPPLDPEVRAAVRAELASRGPEALHAELAGVDPAAARRLAPRDAQRVVRALEVYRASGRPLSEWHALAGPPRAAPWRWLGLELAVPLLERRIAERTRWMFANGLIEETRQLLEGGRGTALRSMRAIGYRQALGVLDGRSTLGAALEQTTLATRQLAKRQRTWFRHQARVEWQPVEEVDSPATLARLLMERLQVQERQGGAA